MKNWILDREEKHVLFSALCFAGFNLGMIRWVRNRLSIDISKNQMMELMNLVFDSTDPKLTLDNFPYHLR